MTNLFRTNVLLAPIEAIAAACGMASGAHAAAAADPWGARRTA